VHKDERGQIFGRIGIGKALALSDEAEITWAQVTYPSLELELDSTCDGQVVLVGTFRPGFGVRRSRWNLDDRKGGAEIMTCGVIENMKPGEVDRRE